jgi:hypothetical protein
VNFQRVVIDNAGVARSPRPGRPEGRKEGLLGGRGYPFTEDGLRRIWKKLPKKEADLPMTGDDRFRMHDLRHGFRSIFCEITRARGLGDSASGV